MGSVSRGKGGGGHSRSSGGKSSRQNAGRGAGSYTSGPPSASSVGGEVGSPRPDVKVVQPLKKQVPSLLDVASSTESLAKMTISAESAQPLSSAVARERLAAVDEAAARAESEHIDTVKYKYVNIDTRKMAHITSLPPTNPNQALAAQKLVRSVKEAQTDIHVICDSRCSRNGPQSPVWVPGWKRTLHRAVGRAVNNDKPSAPALNTVIDDIFGQVSRAINRGDSGPALLTFSKC